MSNSDDFESWFDHDAPYPVPRYEPQGPNPLRVILAICEARQLTVGDNDRDIATIKEICEQALDIDEEKWPGNPGQGTEIGWYEE